MEGYIAFKWAEMDGWFEEDEEIYVHPRDPYVRVDALPSSHHVRVELNGETVAETHRPVLLFKTGLPTRYYIPLTDVRMDLLEPSQSLTQCPYKGLASYYSLRLGRENVRDAAWYYPFPLPEAGQIQNMLAFYPQKVDAIYVDGELQSKNTLHPSTNHRLSITYHDHWSSAPAPSGAGRNAGGCCAV